MNKIDITKIDTVKDAISNDLDGLVTLFESIRNELGKHADGKNLKGDEVVSWLGLIYSKMIYGNRLYAGQENYFTDEDGKTYAVKSRKGNSGRWNETGLISEINGENPDYLVFMQFNENYKVINIWKYDWATLMNENRFLPKVVKRNRRAWTLTVDVDGDGLWHDYSIHN